MIAYYNEHDRRIAAEFIRACVNSECGLRITTYETIHNESHVDLHLQVAWP